MPRKDPEARKEYQREYRIKNIEKIKEREKKHYHDNIEAYKIKSKRYYETHKDQFKEYRKTHPELISEINSRYQKSMNEESRLTAYNHYQKWTPDEIEILKHMIKQGYTYKEISSRLGRTVKSICTALCKMRKNGDPFNGNPVDI